MVLEDFKVLYSTLRYWRLWCVSFLTICFECDKNCHFKWETNRCNIIFIYCILRHIDVTCLILRWRHWCVNCIFFTSFETGEFTATWLYSFNHCNTINRRRFLVFIETINVKITSTATRWTSYLNEKDVTYFRYENSVSAGSGARYTICQNCAFLSIVI